MLMSAAGPMRLKKLQQCNISCGTLMPCLMTCTAVPLPMLASPRISFSAHLPARATTILASM